MMEQRERLQNLQAGRAAAALAVVFCHLTTSLPAFGQAMPSGVSAVAFQGFLGVDFFFVLSGFIIAFVHGEDGGGAASARAYLVKRLLRIYVPYLPIAIGLVLLFAVAPNLKGEGRSWNWLTTLTLLPSPGTSVISIAWTLVHELAFYAIFLVSYFVSRRIFVGLVILWTLAICVLWATGYRGPDYSSDWMDVFFAPINLEFVAGMVGAIVFKRLSGTFWPAFLAVALTLLALCIALGMNRILFGLSIAFFVVALALIERSGWRAPNWAVAVGNASYSIYLLHLTVFSIVMRLTAPLGSWVVGSIVAVAAVVAVSLAYSRIYELRFIHWSRSRLLPQAT